MESRTHLRIDPRLCGEVAELSEGSATVRWQAPKESAVDDHGLVHGGFVFGVADYAAMLAVNDPHVVLGGAECRFLVPVMVGDELEARATVEEEDGRKRPVRVVVARGETVVLTGTLTCYVLDRHVLDMN